MQSKNQEIAQLRKHYNVWKNKCFMMRTEILFLQRKIDTLEEKIKYITSHPYAKENYKIQHVLIRPLLNKNNHIRILKNKLEEVRKCIRKYWLKSGDQKLLKKLSEITK